MHTDASVVLLDINSIIPNKYQPRKVFDEASIETLAQSIKTYGIINPILVRQKEDKYEIIAGERRYRAAKKIGLDKVPAIIKDPSEQQMAELALIENIQRQSLSPIEEAKSYEEIMKIGNQTQESLAAKLGKSQSSIANKIRLLSLPEEIQEALAHKKISERHARSLLNISEKEQQLELLNRIINEKLTVKETEQIIKEDEINEEEIQQAISDIMKSLNIKEETQKEEKEDDNMNNGNFFPNYDNNNAMNNNASLNMMNMQSMGQQPLEAAPEMVMPTIAPMNEQIMSTGIVDMQPKINQMPSFDQFAQSQPQEFNMPNNLNPMDQFMGGVMPQNNMEPQMMNIPQPDTFGAQFATPTPQPELYVAPPMIDEPLFNPNITMPTPEQSMQYNPVGEMPSSFDIPVTNNEPLMAPPVDRLTELKNLLSANGYNFKVYSNNTDNCVIIELPINQ